MKDYVETTKQETRAEPRMACKIGKTIYRKMQESNWLKGTGHRYKPPGKISKSGMQVFEILGPYFREPFTWLFPHARKETAPALLCFQCAD